MQNWTLITGASEGLGAEFARIAAKSGRNIILTARSEDKLNILANDLRTQGNEVVVIPADLSDMTEVERLWDTAIDGRQIDFLVNNAGLGRNGQFADGGWDRELASINVNITALTRLMKLAVAHMTANGSGRILNVASTAGFLAGPNMAVYHATKAYVLFLSEAVAEELRGTRVTVTALCPGATATSFFDSADMHDIRLLKMGLVSDAHEVAKAGWAKALGGGRISVPGFMNKLFAFAPRLMPRSWMTWVTKIIMGKT
jgi:short-subunit dehydrogenase